MKKYVFKPYNPIFPKLFEAEKGRILSHLKKAVLIEHIGSTAIPNLGGKGIIDIAIGVPKEEINATSIELQNMGYLFRQSGSTPNRLFFRADLPDPEEGMRRYHIHLTDPESPDWKDFLTFRDRLRGNPTALQEYADIKKKAVQEANGDGELYRKLKEPLFKKT